MRLLEQLATISALTSIACAAPHPQLSQRTNNVIGSTKFTVPQGPPKLPGKKIAGPIALARVYGKYSKLGASAPAHVNDAASAAAGSNDGTVVASPEQYDQAYLESVSVGGTTLNLDFDTGSSDLWVFSSELPTSEQANHNIYDPTSSSSAKELTGATWSISYGDGSSASGNVYTDTVAVGGTTVPAQAVEAAQTISSEFASDQSDGLLGLAFSSINTVSPTAQNTFFANAESSLDAPLFTADLLKGTPGSYDFGFIDDSKYTGDITYTPVDSSQGFWGFTAAGYTIGSKTSSTSFAAIADTGTSLLLAPAALVKAYYAQVTGAKNDASQGGYTFPCSADLPDISISIGGYAAVVPGDYVNYAPVSDGSATCFGGVQSDEGVGFSIFGDVFLKSQFVVFEDASGGPRLGFAAKELP